MVPLYLFKDGLPACSTARQVSQEPWNIPPKAESQVTESQVTYPPMTPEPRPVDFNGTSATKLSIIFASICVLFNLIRF